MKTYNFLKKIEKIVYKSIKKINKEIDKDARFLGRFFIRICFSKIEQRGSHTNVSYCFEFIDKKNWKREFFSFGFITQEKIDVVKFQKKLNDALHTFIVNKTDFWLVQIKKDKQIINYRKVKIDY